MSTLIFLVACPAGGLLLGLLIGRLTAARARIRARLRGGGGVEYYPAGWTRAAADRLSSDITRLDRTLDDHAERIARLEGMTSLPYADRYFRRIIERDGHLE